jgi:hypothetical protein
MPNENEELLDTPEDLEESNLEDDGQVEDDGQPDVKAELERLRQEKNGLIKKTKALEKALKDKGTSEPSAELTKRLEALEVELLGDIPEEVLNEAKSYSKLKGISLKQAVKSDFIQFQLKQVESRQREEEASISNGEKAPAVKKTNYEKASPKDFDLSTEQGRNDWEGYKKWLQSQG